LRHPLLKYLRKEALPTIFCPGCGNGIVAKAFFHALDELGIDSLRDFVFVSGIGCAAWIPSPYIKADSIHVLHGRALPVATGIKLVRPELNVVVIGGDGDIAGIGGNHLVHAARRNMDILVIMVNNMVYGMTGGQVSPTTPISMVTPTTPKGNIEPPLDTCEIIKGCGANYVARWSVGHYMQLKNSFKEAITIDGFRFIEVIAQCTARVSSRQGLTAGEHIKQILKRSIPLEKVDDTLTALFRGKIVVGKYADRRNPGYLDRMEAGRE
jgi:2-oxoglutarate ferredoxin oxidoreductase subunit beta